MYVRGYQLSKAGVMLLDLLDLLDGNVHQCELDLEDEDESELEGSRLMQAMDAVNGLYDKGTLHFGSTDRTEHTRDWGMKQERRTPCYTTRCDEKPVVRAWCYKWHKHICLQIERSVFVKKTERVIGFFDIKIAATYGSEKKPYPPITPYQALRLIATLSSEEKGVLRAGNKQTHGVIDWAQVDVETDLIFLRADKDIADPIFKDFDTAAFRELLKTESEGHAYTAHAVIFHEDQNADTVELLLETAQGLSSRKISMILGALLRRSRKKNPTWFRRPHPSGATGADGLVATVDVSYEFDIHGHISASFEQELASGKISDIELIEDKIHETEWDSDGFFKEKKKIVTLGVSETDASGNVSRLSRITNLLTANSSKYDKARIKFKSATGGQQTVNWNKHDGLDEKYVKKILIKNFSPPLKSAHANFDIQLLTKMRSLKNESNQSIS